MANISCPLPGGRALHSVLLRTKSSMEHCARPVLEDVANAELAVVVTYSAGSLAAARGFQELAALGHMLLDRGRSSSVRAIIAGKGSRCASENVPFARWRGRGWVHCIDGPNVGARESHTVWAFCHDFYRHLPRAVLFVQDDPGIQAIRRDIVERANWASELEASFARRAALGASASAYQPWSPTPCACSVVRESFSMAAYGGYRPLHWWLRSFFMRFANGTDALPSRLLWPATAQFVVPRAAIKQRSREFHALNMRLTEVAAPLKSRVARDARANAQGHARSAKWANFGPMVVDLGAAPPRSEPVADRRPGINGMDFAQLYERGWFQAFDPALAEARPVYVECFERAAIALSPMRCAGASCPYRAERNAGGGCAATDAKGRTTAPPGWPYAPGMPDAQQRRCLGGSCITGPQPGSGAWARRRS